MVCIHVHGLSTRMLVSHVNSEDNSSAFIIRYVMSEIQLYVKLPRGVHIYGCESREGFPRPSAESLTTSP